MTEPRLVRIESPVGRLVIAADARGALLCEFLDERDAMRHAPALPPGEADPAMLDRLRDELAAYFAGTLQRFTVPLAPLGTAFQQAAWQQLSAIPFGQTRSYAQQAVAVGNAKAVRAVAGANRRNFRGILIPCHRVIGSNGTLVGFGGGLVRKQWLLDHERAQLRL